MIKKASIAIASATCPILYYNTNAPIIKAAIAILVTVIVIMVFSSDKQPPNNS